MSTPTTNIRSSQDRPYIKFLAIYLVKVLNGGDA